MTPRPYQQRTIDQLYSWWMEHQGVDEIPLMVLPTAAGKSIVIAELVRLLFEYFPIEHPRTVILVPSKELAEQNADKLRRLLPPHIRVGYYSASLGKKEAAADVIVATIGSIYQHAEKLGNIKIVLLDEAHMVSPNGKEAGRYRQFLTSLSQLCDYRVAGCTATPFRGNGVWLTDGDDPLFTGICSTVSMNELIDAKYLSPMVRPVDVIATRITTDGISTSSGDYKLDDLADRVDEYLPSAADESIRLAEDRKKWIAFLPTVATAEHFVALLNERGIHAVLVCGSTPKVERENLIAQYKTGGIRCLVTVLALATGFDVPDVDCVIWLRPTISPVLYVQGAGRGMRISQGKKDCLWLDFSDTTDRLGPIDTIKGRKKRKTKEDQGAPYCICGNCGTRVRPASALECPECGFLLREDEPDAKKAEASQAPVLSRQITPEINTYNVRRVSYSLHKKKGKPDSLKVTYHGTFMPICSEWICFDHTGYARQKAESWWSKRLGGSHIMVPATVNIAIDAINSGCWNPLVPASITVNETSKYPEIIGYTWP